MKYQPGILDPFISPVTGKLRSYNSFPFLEEDYILTGDYNGNVYESPILIDVRLELASLRALLSKTKFILQTSEDDLMLSQSLDKLNPGILKHNEGIISIAIPGTDYLAELPPLNAYTINIGPISYGLYEMWQGTNAGKAVASYSVSMFLAQVDYAFKTTNWIIGKSGIVPGALVYPGAQFIEVLPSGRILTHVNDGEIGVANLTYTKLWIGDENNIPVETQVIGLVNLTDLSYKAIWRGNAAGRPEETQDLTILEGKVTLIEDVKIPAIEAEITSIQAEIASIEAEIAVIQGQVSVLEAAVSVIQGQIIAIYSAISGLDSRITNLESRVSNLETNVSNIQAQIIVIQGQITDINNRINNLSVTLIGDVTGTGLISSEITTELQLTLDQIKLAQNSVNLNNNKIINLNSDNVEQYDGLNAKFLWDLMHDEVGVVWQ